MNVEPRAEICDSTRPILTNSAISQNSIECHLNQQNGGKMADTNELTKKVLKLELNQRSDTEKGSIDLDEKSDLKSPNMDEVKSPKSPLSNSSKSSTQSQINKNKKKSFKTAHLSRLLMLFINFYFIIE